MAENYDAVLVVGFGGPEGPDDVAAFLENVLRGKNVPRQRMLEVAEHYRHFGGISPLNEQVRSLIAALAAELNTFGPHLPLYWGNRNWHPLLADTVAQMKADGVRHALALMLSGYSSYSSCRQYRENLAAAQDAAGDGAPRIDKLRVFYNHPHFIAAWRDRVAAALAKVPEDRRELAEIIFSAHSIPLAMAAGCRYEPQLWETCRLVAQAVGHARWTLGYQSRSGPPSQPWLAPDVCDFLRELHAARHPADVVIVPIGFLSDHIEILYDLDTEAAAICEELGINYVRSSTPGAHPKIGEMYRLLIEERMTATPDRLAVGREDPSHDVCPADCCPSGCPMPVP